MSGCPGCHQLDVAATQQQQKITDVAADRIGDRVLHLWAAVVQHELVTVVSSFQLLFRCLLRSHCDFRGWGAMLGSMDS
jgi:hypothetical protein